MLSDRGVHTDTTVDLEQREIEKYYSDKTEEYREQQTPFEICIRRASMWMENTTEKQNDAEFPAMDGKREKAGKGG